MERDELSAKLDRLLAQQLEVKRREYMRTFHADRRSEDPKEAQSQLDQMKLQLLDALRPSARSVYDPTTQPFDEPFRHVDSELTRACDRSCRYWSFDMDLDPFCMCPEAKKRSPTFGLSVNKMHRDGLCNPENGYKEWEKRT